jgi:hypothetical protein
VGVVGVVGEEKEDEVVVLLVAEEEGLGLAALRLSR